MGSNEQSSRGRAGKRKDRRARFATREPKLGYYLIVTDTEETEKNYFEGLRNSLPAETRDRIVIKVEKAKTTYNLIDRALELSSAQAQQRIIWIVFDRDEVKTFDGMIEASQRNDIHTGWSNPCFEIWMLAYFGEMPNIADSVTCCSRFAERFEKATGQAYRKNDANIYNKLAQVGDFRAAYRLAERNLRQAESEGKKPSASYPACTVHLLVKEILDKAEGRKPKE